MRFSNELEDTVNITADASKSRLDAFISAKTGRSRAFVQALAEAGHITVNGVPASKSYKIKENDAVQVNIYKEQAPDLTPKDIEIDVLFDCAEYAVINKPAGLTVHPAPGNYDSTLVNALLHKFNIKDDNDFRPGIVHRLDKDTSGLIIIAKNRDARQALAEMFASRTVDKRYLAVCFGIAKFNNKIIDAPIARSRFDRKKMTVDHQGREAKSEIFVLKQMKNSFLAEIKIYTGRTHQIRVHTAHINHPILGDEVYGGKNTQNKGISRQALHSWKLSFTSPFTKEVMNFEAEMPDDMKKLV